LIWRKSSSYASLRSLTFFATGRNGLHLADDWGARDHAFKISAIRSRRIVMKPSISFLVKQEGGETSPSELSDDFEKLRSDATRA
jgi:hypothetical protein